MEVWILTLTIYDLRIMTMSCSQVCWMLQVTTITMLTLTPCTALM